MRVFNVQSVARPLPQDRNGSVKTASYQNTGTAPHGQTQRWIYTVPANRKCSFAHALARIDRDTAATTAAAAFAQIIWTPNGGSAVAVCVAFLFQLAVGAGSPMNVGKSAEMNAGDTVIGQTQDGSTGGSTVPTVTWSGVEYDA